MDAPVGNVPHPLSLTDGESHASTGRTPLALADESDQPTNIRAAGPRTQAQVWLQEPGEPTVWHIASEWIGYGWYRMACGWEHQPADAERLWPTKHFEPGPPMSVRCRSCVEMHAIDAQLSLESERALHPAR